MKLGFEVLIERGAGSEAGFADDLYQGQGAQLGSRPEIFAQSDIVVRVQAIGGGVKGLIPDLEAYRPGQIVLGFLDPLGNAKANQELSKRGVTLLAMELLPRITRAQSMDALSAMATISGYQAVLLAAQALPKMFPMMMTAAGTYSPARVLVLGAGVAGLQAIATSRRLGAAVTAYDVRPAVKEQVESLGAKFLELPLDTQATEGSGGYASKMDDEFYRRQREMMARAVAESDVVITTAQIPGASAPVLVTDEMVSGMKLGSVIVDLAAETGGNCSLTKAGATVVEQGVTIIGPLNLPSAAASQASQMYARNIVAFLTPFTKDGQFRVDLEDPIIKATLVASDGEVAHPQVRERLGLSVPVHNTGT